MLLLVHPDDTHFTHRFPYRMYTSVTSAVAAGASLLFGRLQSSQHQWGKEPFLTLGASSYLAIALQFLVLPEGSSWNRWTLLLVYIFLGLGRSIYEGMYPTNWQPVFSLCCHSFLLELYPICLRHNS